MKIETDKYYCIPKECGVLFWNDIVEQYPGSTYHWNLSEFLDSDYKSFVLQYEEEIDGPTLRRSSKKDDLTLYEPEEVAWV